MVFLLDLFLFYIFNCICALWVLTSCGSSSKQTTSEVNSSSAPRTPVKSRSTVATVTPTSGNTPVASKPTSPVNSKIRSGHSDVVRVDRQVPTEPNYEVSIENAAAPSVDATQLSKETASQHVKTENVKEDSFDQLQPRKRDCKRAAQIRGCLVPNQGDYKTWNKQMETDFSKSIEAAGKSAAT